MAVGLTLIIVCIVVIGIYILVELKKFKHQMGAFFLMALILFGYISFVMVTNDHELDLKSFSGLVGATKIYFSWMGSVFGNIRTMTSHAIALDWAGDNSTSG